MHPTFGYELAKAVATELRRQAQREAQARAARRARRTPGRLNVDDAPYQALVASTPQRSDAPGAGVVAEAITAAAQRLGTDGCTSRMAEEFGDHPEAAAAHALGPVAAQPPL